jgi:hypothetical protein
MKTILVLFLSVAAIACAEDKKPEGKKRLESVTWDLKAHKLLWVVQTGSEKNGQFVTESTERYEISPDDAVMAVEEERLGFTREEAASLHKLLDTLSLYCAESVVWWDQGQGEKLDSKSQPKRQKVEDQKPTAPGPHAAPRKGEMVAQDVSLR